MKQIPPAHAALYELLKTAETKNGHVTDGDIIKATGWKDSSLRTYFGKGQLPFLFEVSERVYGVSGVTKLTPITFSKYLSQSKHRRELGHNCKSKLARALLKKSKDNMVLALEIYNRPSLQNRLDGFVLLFSTAWEQLLKAIIIEQSGENAIFKEPAKSGLERETISLRDCIEALFKSDDPVRRNLEQIKYYRDKATHLLMPELQFLISRIFQSGVQNYSESFEQFSEQNFIEQDSSGLMTIVGDFQEPNVLRLKELYGNSLGSDIFELAKTIEEDVSKINDIKFAIPLDIKLVFAKDGSAGEPMIISKAEDGMQALKNAVIVEKPVDRSKTHPFRASAAINEINKLIKLKLDVNALSEHLPSRDTKTNKPKFSQNCFQAAVHHFKWKSNNNKHHHLNRDPETHYYSPAAIDAIVKNVLEDKTFLVRAKKKYAQRNKGT